MMYTLDKILEILTNNIDDNKLDHEHGNNIDVYIYQLDDNSILESSHEDKFLGYKIYLLTINGKNIGSSAGDNGTKRKIFRLLERYYKKFEGKSNLKSTKTFEEYTQQPNDKKEKEVRKTLDPLLRTGLVSVTQFDGDSFKEYNLELEINKNKLNLPEHLAKMLKNHMVYMTYKEFIKFLRIYKKKFIDEERLKTEELEFIKLYNIKYVAVDIEKYDLQRIKNRIDDTIKFMSLLNKLLRKLKSIKSIDYYIIPYESNGDHVMDILLVFKKN